MVCGDIGELGPRWMVDGRMTTERLPLESGDPFVPRVEPDGEDEEALPGTIDLKVRTCDGMTR